MKVDLFFEILKKNQIDTIAGVPDSTLKVMCDYLNSGKAGMQHFTMTDEGAALAYSLGKHLATGKTACVYMQNSGIGNIVNPLTSLVNEKVYKTPVLLIIGWRGEPGTKDEPQHKFMGEITTDILEVLGVEYSIIDKDTTIGTFEEIMQCANACFARNGQYAIVAKKGTFDNESFVVYENQNGISREEAICKILEYVTPEDLVVSTTGKISRELYENSDRMYGNHSNIFMSVGGMGYANMIAYGVANSCPEKKVYCIDGDGALLMHLGNMQFIGTHKCENYIHICLNNGAHESVGGMPTANSAADFARLARDSGYVHAEKVTTLEELETELKRAGSTEGPIFMDVAVTVGSREDLVRPKETAEENKRTFMGKVVSR